jgi:hypothetical protein
MSQKSIFLISPNSDLSAKLPSGSLVVLIDDRDHCWHNKETTLALTLRLLKNGSRYFVCYGASSETIHDEIDWIVIENNYKDVITTHHADESIGDVADFFTNVAMDGNQYGVVFTDYSAEWMSLFALKQQAL